MSLQTRLSALITAIGTDVKSLNTAITAINSTPRTYTWTYGDADPTVGGTVTLPSGVKWILIFTAAAGTQPIPSWAPSGSLTVRPS